VDRAVRSAEGKERIFPQAGMAGTSLWAWMWKGNQLRLLYMILAENTRGELDNLQKIVK
jgi:hypothetical protein